MLTRCLFLLLLVLPASLVRAQDDASFYVRWAESQRQTARRYATISFVEESVRRYDGPQGERRIRLISRFSGPLGAEKDWQRAIERVEVNGRPVPPGETWRGQRFLSRHRDENLVLPLSILVRDLRVEGRLDADGNLVRIDLMAEAQAQIERATLWFDRARLVRSRVVMRPRREAEAPLVVETEYHRVHGLDVPLRRHSEGMVRLERRGRPYTMLYAQEAEYRDYRFGRAAR